MHLLRHSVTISDLLICVISADDRLKRVQTKPGTRWQHLCCQVQPQRNTVPPGFLLGWHCAPIRCGKQHHADEVPALSSSSWLCLLCRSQICIFVQSFYCHVKPQKSASHTDNIPFSFAGPNSFLEWRFRCTIKNSWFEHRPRYVTNTNNSFNRAVLSLNLPHIFTSAMYLLYVLISADL